MRRTSLPYHSNLKGEHGESYLMKNQELIQLLVWMHIQLIVKYYCHMHDLKCGNNCCWLEYDCRAHFTVSTCGPSPSIFRDVVFCEKCGAKNPKILPKTNAYDCTRRSQSGLIRHCCRMVNSITNTQYSILLAAVRNYHWSVLQLLFNFHQVPINRYILLNSIYQAVIRLCDDDPLLAPTCHFLLGSSVNTARMLFFGTRKKIADWVKFYIPFSVLCGIGYMTHAPDQWR